MTEYFDLEGRQTGRRSYEGALKAALAMTRARCAVEWGPGDSTAFILAESQAEVWCVEHAESYYLKAAERFAGNPRVHLHHVPIEGGECAYAVCAYEFPAPDLVFVDGRRRVECALVARQILRPGGLVVMHDWDRWQYVRPLSGLFRVLSVYSYRLAGSDPRHTWRTAVLSPDGPAERGL